MPDSRELKPITRNDLDSYLKELGKEFRRLNGTKMPAEIILTGGAAVLVGYGFRELTYDVDAIIRASSVMKDAINKIRDKYELPHGWLNADLTNTQSYSDKLYEVSVYYRTFSNILQVRTVAAEYLLAMKLKSGRRYKNDLSDVVGILWEHQKRGEPMPQQTVNAAIETLYGKKAAIPKSSKQLLDAVSGTDDYEKLYREIRKSEIESREILIEFEQANPGKLKEENIDEIINAQRRKRASAYQETPKQGSLLQRLEKAKAVAEAQKNDASDELNRNKKAEKKR